MSKTHELPTFLSESIPVELVSELRDFSVEGSTVTLRCASTRFEPQIQNYYGTNVETTPCSSSGRPHYCVTTAPVGGTR